MTVYQIKVLQAVQKCPGAGAINVCDYAGGAEALDVYNARRALIRLTAQGWIDSNGYLTEQGERYLKGVQDAQAKI